MSIPNPKNSQREPRGRELAKLRKIELLALWRDGAGQSHVWSSVSPAQWNKEEIIAEILRHEIGERELCGAPDFSTGLLCSIAAHTLHSTHRHDLDLSKPSIPEETATDRAITEALQIERTIATEPPAPRDLRDIIAAALEDS